MAYPNDPTDIADTCREDDCEAEEYRAGLCCAHYAEDMAERSDWLRDCDRDERAMR